MFVIILTYIKPLEQVDELVPAHRAFLKTCYEKKLLICSGRQNPPVGGVILSNADSLETVWSILRQDPFYLQSVAKYEVIEFTPALHDERFACFLK